MIEPTVGRVVWYRPVNDTIKRDSAPPQPLAAIVCYVHGPRMVNLAVHDPMGLAQSRTSVTLVQEGDDIPVGQPYCEWMPYQIGQAKKDQK